MRIVFTGLTEDDVEQVDVDGAGSGRVCYLCKREDGSESFLLQGEPDNLESRYQTLQVNNVPFSMHLEKQGDVEITFPLCQECELMIKISPLGNVETKGD